MNDLLKNPLIVFIAGLLALWLLFKLLNVVLSYWGLLVLAFVVLFFVNSRFRSLVRNFFNSVFNR